MSERRTSFTTEHGERREGRQDSPVSFSSKKNAGMLRRMGIQSKMGGVGGWGGGGQEMARHMGTKERNQFI